MACLQRKRSKPGPIEGGLGEVEGDGEANRRVEYQDGNPESGAGREDSVMRGVDEGD